MKENSIKKTKKILVVDDLLYVAKTIAKILQNEGYKVITALSGKDTLEKFQKYNPDLITIDQKLPDMSGFELVLKLRKLKKGQNAKIIFISGVYDKDVIESILQLGINNYLLKPVSNSKLLETVQRVLE